MKTILLRKLSIILFFLIFNTLGWSQISDDFTDGNFTASPVWSGDTGSFAVSTAATLPSGSAATDGFFLASNASTANLTLTTPSTEVSEWAFSLGSPTFSPSSANYIGVILMSSAAVSGSLITSSWNGYYLRIGVDNSTDPIELWRKNGTTTTKIGNFPSSANYGANALRDGLNLRVTRNSSGQFEVFYSTGFTYAATPGTSAGTLTDATFSTSSFFGVYQIIANAAATRRVYIDNVVIGNPSANVAPTASSVAFTGTLEVGQLLTGTYTYNDTDGDAQGTSTFRWFRADDVNGLNEVAIPSATGSTYTLNSSELNKFISFGVTPIAATGTTTGTEVKSTRQGTVTSNHNSLSTITYDATFTPTANVNYSSFTGTDVTASSFQIARFNLNDISGTPDDGLATTLTALSFNLTNHTSIEKIALYDDTNTEIQELTPAATVNFTGLAIVAASGASKSFSVLLTFKTTVTDNAQPHLTISNATANSSGSLFATANAGGAGSSISGDDNKIEVTATALSYATNATTSVLNVPMTPAVVVRAIDSNSNVDLDYTANIDITSSGTLSVSPVSVAATAGVATFSTITHTQSGLGLHLTVSSGAFIPVVSAGFDVYNPIFSNAITGSNPNAANPYTTGQVVDANITATGIGRGSGIVGTAANDRYNANTWNTPSFDANKYFTFTLTPNPTKEINFVNLVYTAQISGVGVLTGYEVRSSVDNYTATIGSPTAAVNPGALVTIDLSGPQFQAVSSSITFRIYAWGAASNTATLSINNFSFNGEVVNSTAPSITASVTGVTALDYFLDGGPSTAKTFTVDAANLSPANDELVVETNNANFEVSTDNITYGPTAPIAYTSGAVTAATVYVRSVAGLGVGTYDGEVTVSGGTAPSDSVTLQGIVRVPFEVPYSNTFRTQAAINDATAQGFVVNNTVFNATGYSQISLNGYIESPVIDFTQQTNLEVYFDGATFGGNGLQTLELQISTDGGANYTLLKSVTYLSATFLATRTLVDVSLYPSTNGKLRIQMVSGTNTTRFRDFVIADYTLWQDEAWSNGEPTAVKVAVIEDDYTGSGLFSARHLVVNSGAVSFENGATVSLQDEITVNGGSLSLQSNANLLQANTLFANTGAITVERQVSIRRLDYVYWSSPVDNQLLDTFSDETLNERFYTLNEPTNAFAWVNPEITNFVTAKGYMIRAPNTFTTSLATFYGTFTGVPHNGNQSIAGTSLDASHGFNMIGNPYPSPINITTFKAANPAVGTLYFWTHFSQDPGASNYATYTSTGAAGANGIVPNGTIQIGQGFIAKLASAGTINFTNAMRIDNHQNQFFRNAPQSEPERHRLWLNLSKESTNYNQILLGYVEGATNAADFEYDGKVFENLSTSLYTIIDADKYIVQGKALPFTISDAVALGFKAAQDGNYTISLANFDGVFANGQHIYIKDNLTGITHNVSDSAYSFASVAGTFENRFQIVYQSTLGVENPVLDNNSVVIFKKDNLLHINAGTTLISEVKVFDIAGRLVYQKNVDNSTTVTLNDLKAANQVLLVQITSNDNRTVTTKVVN